MSMTCVDASTSCTSAGICPDFNRRAEDEPDLRSADLTDVAAIRARAQARKLPFFWPRNPSQEIANHRDTRRTLPPAMRGVRCEKLQNEGKYRGHQQGCQTEKLKRAFSRAQRSAGY